MSLGGWSIGPSLLYVGFAGLLYWLGGLSRRRRADDGVRTAAFVAGLVTIVVALDSPIDRYAEQLFWIHMLQHVLLLTVAPPLILLGRPWPRMWRGLPLRWRTNVGRGIARGRVGAPLRSLARPLLKSRATTKPMTAAPASAMPGEFRTKVRVSSISSSGSFSAIVLAAFSIAPAARRA